jgi:uncharacterized membrane protein YfcA
MGSVFGFWALLKEKKHYLYTLAGPTFVGSLAGAELLINTGESTFAAIVPFLILLASGMLILQKKVKQLVLKGERELHPYLAILLQFLVSLYGGYFGAGMGIMMLAVFALYMKGTLHEINAIKSWLGVIINLVASATFILHSVTSPAGQGLVDLPIGIVLAVGGIIGGFYAAKLSQKVDPDKLRVGIAAYGLLAALYYAAKAAHLI